MVLRWRVWASSPCAFPDLLRNVKHSHKVRWSALIVSYLLSFVVFIKILLLGFSSIKLLIGDLSVSEILLCAVCLCHFSVWKPCHLCLPLSPSASQPVALLFVRMIPSFTCLPALSVKSCVSPAKHCACSACFISPRMIKVLALEMPHAEVVHLLKGAFFCSLWADYTFTGVRLLPFHPWHVFPDVCHSQCRPNNVSVIIRVFQSFLIYPTCHPHAHTHIYASSIAIPEESRLVWQWVALCPWTQWHPAATALHQASRTTSRYPHRSKDSRINSDHIDICTHTHIYSTPYILISPIQSVTQIQMYNASLYL